jgi:hypothetical protein
VLGVIVISGILGLLLGIATSFVAWLVPRCRVTPFEVARYRDMRQWRRALRVHAILWPLYTLGGGAAMLHQQLGSVVEDLVYSRLVWPLQLLLFCVSYLFAAVWIRFLTHGLCPINWRDAARLIRLRRQMEN